MIKDFCDKCSSGEVDNFCQECEDLWQDTMTYYETFFRGAKCVTAEDLGVSQRVFDWLFD